jgi:hypothetical protein
MQNSGHLSADRWSHALRSDQNMENSQRGGGCQTNLKPPLIVTFDMLYNRIE